MLYVSLMVMTNQKPIIDTQNIVRKKSKHDTEESVNHREESKRRRKEQRKTKQPEINNSNYSINYSINNSNVKGLNFPIKRHSG